MRRGRTGWSVVLAGSCLVAGWAVAGCASPSGGGATADPPAADPPAADPPGDVPDFPDGTGRQSGEGANESDLVLVDVRVTAGDGFSRIVLEFRGSGTPGWVVDYVDRPVLEGSGDVVDLDGEATLDVYASGATWPAPGYYDGPARIAPPRGGAVEDVYVGGTFEGYTQVLAGIDGDRVPFRAFALEAPSRLVVDVVDDG